MDENKINYSDLALGRDDSPTTINEKLLTEQTEHIFSEDQALEILSEFENNGIQAGMAKQLEVLLANKEEYETAIGEIQDKKKIIEEKDNPNPENIRGYDVAEARSREEIRKIDEQIATLEKGLEEMNNTQNPEKDLPATEERTPEEPQNPATPVTPQDEDTRVAEARTVENNPETTQDTTDSKEWKKNPNDYRTILGEIKKSENELRRLKSERDALTAAQENMDKETYQREMSAIERFLEGEQLKLDQNRNLANNYEAAYSLLKYLDGLTGQPNNSRDAQDREAREEEITAKRKELASHMDELTDTLAAEVRNRVLSERANYERANRNNNVVGLTPEEIISRYAPFAEIYDNNEIKETDPQVLVAEAERQIREREAAKEETANKVALRKSKPNRVRKVISSHVAGAQEETTPESVIAAVSTRKKADLELTPEEVIRIYGPAAKTHDDAGITGTREQRLVAEAERQIREREAAKEETANKVAVRKIKPNRVINVIPSHVAGVSEEPVTEKPAEEKVDVPKTNVEEPTPEPGITTPPVSEEQKGNAIVSTPLPTNLNNPADALHNSDAQSEYNEALQDFLKIFDEERNETKEKGPFTTMEALNEFHDKYFALKETANERLVNAKKRLEESRAKNAEQPRTTNTPNSSILALPAANKEKSPALGLPAHVPKKSGIIHMKEIQDQICLRIQY